MIKKFFRKKQVAAPMQPVTGETRSVNSPLSVGGFFSTDVDIPVNNPVERALRTNATIAKSIQRTNKDMTALDSAGNKLAVGMDSSLDLECVSGKSLTSGLGIMPAHQFEWYAGQGFIGWQLAAVLSQNWLIDKACTVPAYDAVRNGYDVEVNDGTEVKPEVFDEIRKLDKRFKLKQNCVELIKMGRIFGIRIAIFLVDDIDYELPFNPDGVKPGSYRGITQIDPYWISPELDQSSAADPMNPEFYNPTWWRVNGRRIHRSHMIVMRNGDEVPDILKPTYMYGGIPTPQKIYERVYAAERTANEAPLLAMTKRLTALKIDMTQAVVNPAEFQERMSLWAALQNNYGVKVIGDADEIQQFDTTLAGLDETIMTQYQLVAAGANMPVTKLLQTVPKGFNATGEYDEASYHEYLESIQENELSPLVNRHHLLLIRSHIAPKFGMSPFNTDVNWNPVDSPTAEEVANINKIKADTDAVLANAGAVDGYDIRQRVINDPDSGYNGLPDIVEGGPGDREAEAEAQEALLANQEATSAEA